MGGRNIESTRHSTTAHAARIQSSRRRTRHEYNRFTRHAWHRLVVCIVVCIVVCTGGARTCMDMHGGTHATGSRVYAQRTHMAVARMRIRMRAHRVYRRVHHHVYSWVHGRRTHMDGGEGVSGHQNARPDRMIKPPAVHRCHAVSGHCALSGVEKCVHCARHGEWYISLDSLKLSRSIGPMRITSSRRAARSCTSVQGGRCTKKPARRTWASVDTPRGGAVEG
jgi:hypothetical protein